MFLYELGIAASWVCKLRVGGIVGDTIDFAHPVAGPVKVVAIPVRLSATPGKVRMPAPEFSQHTEEVLIEVAAYNWEEIAQLKAEEVI